MRDAHSNEAPEEATKLVFAFENGQVCPEFCVNDRVLFSGMGRWGRGHFPFPGPSL